MSLIDENENFNVGLAIEMLEQASTFVSEAIEAERSLRDTLGWLTDEGNAVVSLLDDGSPEALHSALSRLEDLRWA